MNGAHSSWAGCAFSLKGSPPAVAKAMADSPAFPEGEGIKKPSGIVF